MCAWYAWIKTQMSLSHFITTENPLQLWIVDFILLLIYAGTHLLTRPNDYERQRNT